MKKKEKNEGKWIPEWEKQLGRNPHKGQIKERVFFLSSQKETTGL